MVVMARNDDGMGLLRLYASQRDETAFREVVGRYLDMVYSVCLRRLGGDADLAKDAAQQVFVDLARKTPAMTGVEHLGGWLHRHAGYVALGMLRAESRRRTREKEAMVMQTEDRPDEDLDSVWRELEPVLDESLEMLNAEDRQALLLRYYEKQDYRSVGAALGVSDDTAQKRVTRALEKLRGLLAGRGVTLSVVSLGTLLGQRAVVGAPTGLAAAVSDAALAMVSPAIGSAASAGWSNSLAVKLGGAVALLGTAAWLMFSSGANSGLETEAADAGPTSTIRITAESNPERAAGAGEEPGRRATLVNDPGIISAPGAATTPPAMEGGALQISVSDAASGGALAGVQFETWAWVGAKVQKEDGHWSDVAGECAVPVGEDVTRLIVVSHLDGYAETRLEWRRDRGEEVPLAYHLRLIRAAAIGGVVVDADGRPVAGAQVGFNANPDPAQETRPETSNFSWPFWVTATTDGAGRWSIQRISQEAIRNLYGGAQHPEYVNTPPLFVGQESGAQEKLLAGEYVFTLGRAVEVRGVVLGPQGGPLAGARVLVGRMGEVGSREGVSSATGSFTVRGCRPGFTMITAEADGYSATTISVTLAEGAGPFEILLQEEAHVMRMRVVDGSGQPVEGANVWLNTFASPTGVFPGESAATPPVQVEFNRKTDAAGRVEWQGAPAGELQYDVAARGFMRKDNITIAADGEEHVVQMEPALTITGTVRAQDTRELLPQFRIVTGWPNVEINGEVVSLQWSTLDRFWLSFEGGEFRHVFEEPAIHGPEDTLFVFKIEAEGYTPHVTRIVRADEGEVHFDIELEPAEILEMEVLLPDGSPAVGVDVGLMTLHSRLGLVPGGFLHGPMRSEAGLLRTDSDGKLKLNLGEEVTRVVGASPEGYGEATPAQLQTNPLLQMQSWGRIEGQYLVGGQPAVDREILFQGGTDSPTSTFIDIASFRTITDADGKFVFPTVPPGSHKLVGLVDHPMTLADGSQMRSSMHQPLMGVEVLSGEVTSVTIGANTWKVTARVHWAEGAPLDPMGSINASLQPAALVAPESMREDPNALAAWYARPELREIMTQHPPRPLIKGVDGTWTAEEVPPGDYVLMVIAVGVGDGNGILARTEVQVVLPGDTGGGLRDLGTLELQ